ncbi:hypothetical protein LEN26_002135 [Aphanomyces euteiches]|nr:hypothetical protein AeMF1_011089 [Aphanomyces euteiches]KAH9159865.1 hypothetical protein LEN26_002135 [Aphanomyces euteiches]KAH9194972.1 hypothetical protein AeNC1_003045 [Aphanomyces euteiches]
MATELKVALNLSKVKFPGRTALSRVQVSVSDDILPMRIGIEAKKTKNQWECVVKDIQEHLAKGATYVLPANVVASSLQRGLSVLDEDKKTEMAIEGCSVAVKGTKNGHLEMNLTLKAFGTLEVDYLFDMAPLSIEKVDILEAKVRDLEEVVERKPAIFGQVYLSLKCTKAVKTGQLLVWNSPQTTNTAYFELSHAKDQITISKPGLYQIQMTGHMQNWSSSYNI